MTWARLDDSFYDHPKILEALDRDPAAVALHARALAYVARHELDGRITERALCSLEPLQSDRESRVTVLIETGIWHQDGTGVAIHDYLDYNPSRADLTERREADRARKAQQRGKAK